LPENTWVIKNMTHVEFSKGQLSGELAVWVVTSDEPVDVHTDSRYPQFIENVRSEGKYRSLTEGVTLSDEESSDSVLSTFTAFIKQVLSFLLKLIGIRTAK
ncbi:MAG: hypothetical protein ACI4GY_10220, partial [Acutalibacteraceae bacterium]